LEDRFGVLLEMKKDFVNIFEIIDVIKKLDENELLDDALLLSEFIKGFYMNYPLKGQHPSLIDSMIDNNKLYSLDDTDIKNLNKDPKEVLVEGNNDYVSIVSNYAYNGINKANTEHKNDLQKFIHLGYKNEAIITFVQARYLSSRIIVRDLTGRHAWLITEHRVIDGAENLEYDDNKAVYKNIISLKGSRRVNDMVEGKKSVKEVLEEEKKELQDKINSIKNSEPSIDKKKLEEKLKDIECNDIFTQIVSLLHDNCEDVRKVS